MNKVLVEVMLPAAGKQFDVYIPLESTVLDITRMLEAALSELSDGKFMAENNSVLCDAVTGDILNPNNMAGELKIKNGARLILI